MTHIHNNCHNCKIFPGQESDEYLDACVHFHWMRMAVFLLSCFFIGAITIALNYLWLHVSNHQADAIFWVVNIVVFSTLLQCICVRIINHMLRIVIVTNVRIIDVHNTAIFYRETETIDLTNIQDLKVKQGGLLERFFNYGRITLHNASGETIFVFSFVAHPMRTYSMLNHIYHKKKRGESWPPQEENRREENGLVCFNPVCKKEDEEEKV